MAKNVYYNGAMRSVDAVEFFKSEDKTTGDVERFVPAPDRIISIVANTPDDEPIDLTDVKAATVKVPSDLPPAKGDEGLTANGDTISVEAGYYPNGASKAVAHGAVSGANLSYESSAQKVSFTASKSAGYHDAGEIAKSATLAELGIPVGGSPVVDLGVFAGDNSENQYGTIVVPYRGRGVYCLVCTETIAPTILGSTTRLGFAFVRNKYSADSSEVGNGIAFTASSSDGNTNFSVTIDGNNVSFAGSSVSRLARKSYHVYFIPAADFGGF